jgi:hypothetical protein
MVMTGIPGFAISWRSKWEHPIFRRKQEAAVWAWMCDTAQWQDYRMPTKFGPIDLKRGELIISEREVADDFGLHRNTLRALIQRMVDDGMITLIRDRIHHRAGTIVSIVKYEQYQQFGLGTEEAQDRKPTESRTEAGPKEDRSGTKNNTDNTYNENNEDTPLPPKGGGDVPDLFRGDEPAPEQPANSKKPRVKPAFTTAEMDDLFTQFATAYPNRDKEHSWKGAKRLFVAALKRKVDPQAIIAGAARYCQESKNERKFGTTYVKDAFNWLNESRWENYTGVHHFPKNQQAGPDGDAYRFKGDRNNPPVGYDDDPPGTKKGWWVKSSRGWQRYAS